MGTLVKLSDNTVAQGIVVLTNAGANAFPSPMTAGGGGSDIAFYSTGYSLNSSGDIVSESESDGSQTRTRTWTYVTGEDGSVTASASAWSYA